MLGPYITSVTPYYYQYNPLIILLHPCNPHIVTIVPHRSPLLFPYIIIVMLALIIPLRLLYIERRSFHLYHSRIVHLCNVKKVSPLKMLNSKVFISLFYLFVSWSHNMLLHQPSPIFALSLYTNLLQLLQCPSLAQCWMYYPSLSSLMYIHWNWKSLPFNTSSYPHFLITSSNSLANPTLGKLK